jgi:hypothetical protein
MKPTPVVSIPIYRPFSRLTNTERVSYDRVVRVLGHHPIILFGPDGLDAHDYQSEARKNGCAARYISFNDAYFRDIASYSRLMLTAEFYKAHAAYSHLLLYQLDAYVFSDELESWCLRGYDYVGAPWVGDKSGLEKSGPLTGVGNGGFCLRNVEATLRVLSTFRPMRTARKLWASYDDTSPSGATRRALSVLVRSTTGWRNNGAYIAEAYVGNEDAFWGEEVPASRYRFNLAPIDAAIAFAFEVAPKYLYGLNGNRLPFGCHAWFKYDPEFWRTFISWRD